MERTDFDWKSGTVTFWDLDALDEDKALGGQIDHLKEDLAQISFPGGIVLDLGWYSSSDRLGEFRVMVVRHRDWDNPVFQAVALDVRSLKHRIKDAIAVSDSARPD